MPLARPDTEQLVVLPFAVVQMKEPGELVAVYEVILAPPLLTGAVHDTVAEPFEATADTPVGAPVTVDAGVSDGDGLDAALLPALFWAVTVNVYPVPFERPETRQLVVLPFTVVQVREPGLLVTVYEMMLAPPSLTGAVQDTVAEPLPPTADTPVGAPATIDAGVIDADGLDATLLPALLLAVTVKV